MTVEDLVDEALVGLDRRELINILPVPDAADWEAVKQSRMMLAKGFSNSKPAERYRAQSRTSKNQFYAGCCLSSLQ
jgi:hypothetical protein